MNGLLTTLGLASWKPLLTSLLLPPTPLLLLLLAAVFTLRRRAVFTRWVCASVAVLIWLSACTAVAERAGGLLLPSSPVLTAARIAELRGLSGESVAIVILGGGVEQWAPEYSNSSLSSWSLERLRYGIWLSHKTGWPVGFSGGTGWAEPTSTALERPPDAANMHATIRRSDAISEASVAKRIAADEWSSPLQWAETSSRDTRENAVNTVAILRARGVRQVLLVTHHWHMPRAVRNFESAAAGSVQVEAAPIGMARQQEMTFLSWIPSGEGLTLARQVIRERLGLLFGA